MHALLSYGAVWPGYDIVLYKNTEKYGKAIQSTPSNTLFVPT